MKFTPLVGLSGGAIAVFLLLLARFFGVDEAFTNLLALTFVIWALWRITHREAK
jgi:hypothetical protein